MNSKSLSIVILFLGIIISNGRTQILKKARNKAITIFGYFETYNENDTITLQLWDHLINERKIYTIPHREFISIVKQGKFSFTVNAIDQPKYFTLSHGKLDETYGNRYPWLKLYLLEPGDSVFIKIGKHNISFSGKGWAKYQCRYEFDKREIEFEEYYRTHPLTQDIINDSLNYFNSMCEYNGKCLFELASKLKILEKYKSSINPLIFEVLRTDIRAAHLVNWYECCFSNYQYFIPGGAFYPVKGLSLTTRGRAIEEINNAIWSNDYLLSPLNSSNPVINFSKDYLNYLHTRISLKNYYAGNKTSIYPIIKNQFKGPLRDRMLTFFFLESLENLNQKDSLLRNALSIVQTPYCKKQLEDIYEKQKKGASAFNFSLRDTADRVVLIDFWFVGCGGCINYYKYQLSEVEDSFRENPDVVFISVSIDKIKQRWIKEGLESGAYTSSTAVNLYTSGYGINDPLIQNYHIASFPRQLLIDKSGKIFSSSQSELRKQERLTEMINKALSKEYKASSF